MIKWYFVGYRNNGNFSEILLPYKSYYKILDEKLIRKNFWINDMFSSNVWGHVYKKGLSPPPKKKTWVLNIFTCVTSIPWFGQAEAPDLGTVKEGGHHGLLLGVIPKVFDRTEVERIVSAHYHSSAENNDSSFNQKIVLNPLFKGKKRLK